MSERQEPGKKNPLTYAMNAAFDSVMRQMMTCLPGRVVSFDAAQQRAQIECGVQRVHRDTGEPYVFPVIENVPVHFSGDSEWYLWHQITPGETEGVVLFSQRSISEWKSQGGPAIPVDFRMFSAADAMFIPGVRSNGHVISGFVNEGCGLSNYAGDVRAHLTNNRIKLSVGASEIIIEPDQITVNGNLIVNGNIGTNGTFENNGVNVGSTHYHEQGDDSDGDSEVPTGPPQ